MNRLKRQSLSHLVKAHQRHLENVLPPNQQVDEPLQDYDNRGTKDSVGHSWIREER